jgi:putative addiction module component (TIGR02574 family)
MSVSLAELGIDQLSVKDRLTLIEQIWESLPEEVSADEIPAWHLQELAKRREEAEKSPGVARLWREALSRFGEGE